MASASSSSRVRPRPSFSDDEDQVVAPRLTGPHAAAVSEEPGHRHGGDEPGAAPTSDSRARIGLDRHVRRRTEGVGHTVEGGVGVPSVAGGAEDAVMEDADTVRALCWFV